MDFCRVVEGIKDGYLRQLTKDVSFVSGAISTETTNVSGLQRRQGHIIKPTNSCKTAGAVPRCARKHGAQIFIGCCLRLIGTAAAPLQPLTAFTHPHWSGWNITAIIKLRMLESWALGMAPANCFHFQFTVRKAEREVKRKQSIPNTRCIFCVCIYKYIKLPFCAWERKETESANQGWWNRLTWTLHVSPREPVQPSFIPAQLPSLPRWVRECILLKTFLLPGDPVN